MTRALESLRSINEVLNEVYRYLKHRLKILEISTIYSEGKICAEDVYAKIDLPPFDRAAVDGYAVRSEDVFSASSSSPIILKIVDKDKIDSGEAREISTGEPLPEGADAVVMYEYTVRRGEYVEILRPVPRWGNVSRRGEDFKKGDLIVRKGKLIDYIDIAALISTGNFKIKVFKINIGLICTGSEIVEPESLKYEEIEEVLKFGKIINSTRFILKQLFKQIGAEEKYYGVVNDDEKEIMETILKALEENDIVVVTGGTAIGTRDVTYSAILRLNPEYVWRGITIRPARPTGVAVISGKPILMLSGFPVAAYVGFQAIGIPIVYKMMNIDRVEIPYIKARLYRRVAKPPNLRTYMRVELCVERSSGELIAKPLAVTGSGLISTLVKGNAILEIPENLEGFEENEDVWVRIVRDLKYCE